MFHFFQFLIYQREDKLNSSLRAFLSLFIIVTLFWSCSKDNSVHGGGGIETVAKTGKIVNEDGVAANSVIITSFPSDYNPLKNDDLSRVFIDTTNDSGYYEIKITKNGNYNILGHSLTNGYKTLIKNITEESLIQVDTIKSTGTMAVFLPQWIKSDSGYVFIPGTDIYSAISDTTDDGILMLSDMPTGLFDQVCYYNVGEESDTAVFKEVSVNVSSNDTIVMEAFGLIDQFSVASGHLLSDTVHSIVKDIYGNKWYGTGSGGVTRLRGDEWDYFTTVNSDLKVNHIYDLWASQNGDVWAGTVGGGVAQFDGSSWNVFDQSNSEIINDSVYVVCGCNACGGVWIGTDYGLMYKPESNDSAWEYYYSGNSPLAGDSIFSLVLNTCGRMFIGTDNGVSFWNGKDWTIWTPGNSNLPGSIIYGMVDGQDGTIWAATNNGVAKYNGAVWQKIVPPVIDYDERYRALAVSNENELWAGSSGIGTILRSKNGMNLLLRASDLGLSLDFVRINDIFPNENGRIEVATHYDGILVLGKTDSRIELSNKIAFSKRMNMSRRF